MCRGYGLLCGRLWEAVGGVLGLATNEQAMLRSLALDAVSTSLGYLGKHAFSLLREFPWSLTQGDIVALL